MMSTIKLLLGKFNLNYLLIWLVISLSVITLLWRLEISRHRLTTQEFEAFKAELHIQAMQKQAIDKLKDELYANQLAKKAKEYQANINRLNLDRAKLKKGLQNEINRTGSLLNDVRLYQNRSSGAGLPKDESASDPSAQEWPDGYRTLIDTCKLTTLDYNALYDAWMLQCNIYRCTE